MVQGLPVWYTWNAFPDIFNRVILKGNWSQSNSFSLNYLFCHETKQHQQKILKVYMEATISILCMFILVVDVTNVATQFNGSEFWNFQSSWKMAKNTIKLCWRLLLHKINKSICKENQWWKDSRVWRHRRDVEFKTFSFHNFVQLIKTPQNFV